MVAPALNVAEKFSALDGLHIVFIPVVAAFPAAATRVEINAGTDLTTEISSWEGFEMDPQTIETPSLARFTGSIPGRINITSGVLNIYADRGYDDVSDVLPDGTTGYLAFMDQGDVPTKKMDLWPVRVNRTSVVRSMEAATMLKVAFTHNELPSERLTIPAAT